MFLQEYSDYNNCLHWRVLDVTQQEVSLGSMNAGEIRTSSLFILNMCLAGEITHWQGL